MELLVLKGLDAGREFDAQKGGEGIVDFGEAVGIGEMENRFHHVVV